MVDNAWHAFNQKVEGLFQVKTSLYASTGCNYRRVVSEVKKSNLIQTSNIVLFQEIYACATNNTATYCLVFFHIRCSGSHLHVTDRSICDQDQNVVK